jgi:hypothetical protein
MFKKVTLTVALMAFIASVANAGRLSEVPKALQGVKWCNENDACIVFGRKTLKFSTIDPTCSIISVNESPPRTYEIHYECGRVWSEKFILQSPERLVQHYWEKQPVGHWGYLLYTPRP